MGYNKLDHVCTPCFGVCKAVAPGCPWAKCLVCLMAKACAMPHLLQAMQCTQPLKELYVDLVEPMSKAVVSHVQYWAIVVDKLLQYA